MDKQIGLALLVVGLVLLIAPFAASSFKSYTLLNSGDSLTNWGTTTPNLGTVAISTAAYVSSPSSIALTTNVTGNPSQAYFMYYLTTWGSWRDISTEPLFNVQVDPTRTASISFNVELIIGSFSKEIYYPPLTGMVANQWNNMTLDLRTAAGGWDYGTASSIPAGTAVDLTGVWGLRFHWISNGFGTDMTTYVDDLQILPAGPTQTLTILAPTGGTLSLSTGAHTYAQGQQVTVTATPSSGYVLDHFVLDSANVGKNANNQYIVTMNAAHTLSAIFTQNSVTQVPVTLISSAGGTTIPVPGSYSYNQGLTETFTAVANSGYVFDHWVVNGVNSGTSVILSISLSGSSYAIQAVFTPSVTPPTNYDWKTLSMVSGVGMMAIGAVVYLKPSGSSAPPPSKPKRKFVPGHYE